MQISKTFPVFTCPFVPKCTYFKFKSPCRSSKSSIIFVLVEELELLCHLLILPVISGSIIYRVKLFCHMCVLLYHFVFPVLLLSLCCVVLSHTHNTAQSVCNSAPLYSQRSLWQCRPTWGSRLPQGTASSISEVAR